MCKFQKFLLGSAVLLLGLNSVYGQDWPTWRYEADRSAISPVQLPTTLYLQWTRQYAAPRSAFDNQSEQYAYGGVPQNEKKWEGYDNAYQPVVVGTTMYFGSSSDDRLTAVNLATGAELWYFYAGAPIRCAPVVKFGNVYFGADDGYMYCLNATTGALVWKYQGSPKARKLMGNDRLISVWPIRGGAMIPNAVSTGNNPLYTDWKSLYTKSASPLFHLIAAGDYAKAHLGDSSVVLGTSSSTIPLNYDTTGGVNQNLVGLRFADSFYSVAANAAIDSAFIQFGAKDSIGGTAPCTLSIWGEKAANSAAFTTTKGNISTRVKTTATVQWIVPAWTVKQNSPLQRTPNLSSIVKEISSTTGYVPGAGNAHITFLIQGMGAGQGIRRAAAKSGDSLEVKLSIYGAGIALDTLTTRPNPVFAYNNADSNSVYFTAGLYPFEGIFVYSLNAQTGAVNWINDGSSVFYTLLPHGTDDGFGGMTPQGYLCAADSVDMLIPNSRAFPAIMNRITGNLSLTKFNGGGDCFVFSQGARFYTNGSGYNISTLTSATTPSQFNDDNLWITAGTQTFKAGSLSDTSTTDWSVTNGTWSSVISGKPAGLIAANGYLIVSTKNGMIYCFGGTNVSNPPVFTPPAVVTPTDSNTSNATAILTGSGYTTGSKGICLCIGLNNGRLCEELANQSDLTVIGLDTNAAKVQAIRQRLDSTGLYGYKIQLLVGDIRTAQLPQYMAQLVVSENAGSGFAHVSTDGNNYINCVFRSLRPYGGEACLPVSQAIISSAVTADNLKNAVVGMSGSNATLTRSGALPGSADWGGMLCDAAHTDRAKDSLIKGPLGLLWFGGSIDNVNDSMLTRHGHGAPTHVCAGHYYHAGPNGLRCGDIYTGRVLWWKPIHNFGEFSFYTEHEAGYSCLGDNYVATPDRVYALGEHGDNLPSTNLYVLNPNTGATMNTFTLPDSLGAWGAISVVDSFIVATTQPLVFDYDTLGDGFVYWYSGQTSKVGVGGGSTYDGDASARIVVLNRNTGAIVWNYRAQNGFWNLAVCAGGGKVFAIDNLPKPAMGYLGGAAATIANTVTPRVKAFNEGTGQLLWVDSASGVFARYLAYSADYNTLIEASRSSSDATSGEPATKYMIARNGTTGARLWSFDTTKSYYGGPVILADTLIYTQSGNYFGCVNIKTGAWQMTNYGIVNKPMRFMFNRHYGCNYGLAAVNLITFRSGSGSYFDLSQMDGVANCSGQKVGCTPSLTPADGIVTNSEYTRSCSCQYGLQTSYALVNNPDVEKWTSFDSLGRDLTTYGGKISSLGIALGAPGDRRDINGVYWHGYPTQQNNLLYEVPGTAGFPSIPVPIAVNVAGTPTYIRHHSARMAGDTLKWVGANCAQGMSSITVGMVFDSSGVPHTPTSNNYGVALYFMEPNTAAVAGQRVFSVTVNGVSAVSNLDIVKTAGGPNTVIKEVVNNVPVTDSLTIAFTASAGQPIISGFSAQMGVTLPVAVITNRGSVMGNQLKAAVEADAGAESFKALGSGVTTGIDEGLKKKPGN